MRDTVAVEPVLLPRPVPALDGVRGVSILLVLLSHAGLDRVVPGGLGVTVFFVVSGFLIGWQLTAEADRTGRVALRAFYLRRVFRLLPALVAYCAVCVLVLLALGRPVPWPGLAAALLYVSNYALIFGSGMAEDPFAITWSLSIEEHFYLVFPVLVLLCTRRPARLVPLGLLAMAGALAWRLWLARSCAGPGAAWATCGANPAGAAAGLVRIYYGSDTRFDAMAAGCVAIAAMRYGRVPGLLPGVLLGRWALPVASGIVVATLLVRDPVFRDTARYTIQGAAIAWALLALSFGPANLATRALAHPAAVALGRISYSLYLYHWAVALLIVPAPGSVGGVAGFLLLSLGLAALSFLLVEQPFLRWRRRFGSHAKAGL